MSKHNRHHELAGGERNGEAPLKSHAKVGRSSPGMRIVRLGVVVTAAFVTGATVALAGLYLVIDRKLRP